MIVVCLERQDENVFLLTVEGHAGMREEGKDIVCAAASILTYTLANAVLAIHADSGLLDEPIVDLSKGYAEIVCSPSEPFCTEVRNIFAFAGRGFTLLHKNFPDYLHCETVGIEI